MHRYLEECLDTQAKVHHQVRAALSFPGVVSPMICESIHMRCFTSNPRSCIYV